MNSVYLVNKFLQLIVQYLAPIFGRHIYMVAGVIDRVRLLPIIHAPILAEDSGNFHPQAHACGISAEE